MYYQEGVKEPQGLPQNTKLLTQSVQEPQDILTKRKATEDAKGTRIPEENKDNHRTQ